LSTLKVNNIQNANGTSAIAIDSSGVATFSKTLVPSSSMMYRNLIINGNMQIAQRGTSATGVTADYATCDRFLIRNNNAGLYTITQDTDAPDGFGNSLKWDCTTANASPAAGDFAVLQYKAEGQDLQQLAFGTPSAKQFTVSFWVKSSETGTAVLRIGAINSGNVTQGHTYIISSANTWEKKTITFTANTSDVIPNDNLIGFNLFWYLATGTNRTSGTLPTTTWEALLTANEAVGQTINIAASTSSYFNITGVQLEVGDTATPFEHRMYSQELAMCQRYFQSFGGSNANETVGQGTSFSTTNTYVLIHLLQTMRSVPSLGYSAVGDWRLHYPGITGLEATGMAISTSDSNNTKVIVNTATATNANMGGGKCIQLTADNTISARLTFSAEI
jgi:hypothetical protein